MPIMSAGRDVLLPLKDFVEPITISKGIRYALGFSQLHNVPSLA